MHYLVLVGAFLPRVPIGSTDIMLYPAKTSSPGVYKVKLISTLNDILNKVCSIHVSNKYRNKSIQTSLTCSSIQSHNSLPSCGSFARGFPS